MPYSWKLFLVVCLVPAAGIAICLIAARLPLRNPDS